MATSGGLRTTGICWLTVLKARSPSAKCGQGWFLLENCSRGCLLAPGDASNLSLETHHILGGGALGSWGIPLGPTKRTQKPCPTRQLRGRGPACRRYPPGKGGHHVLPGLYNMVYADRCPRTGHPRGRGSCGNEASTSAPQGGPPSPSQAGPIPLSVPLSITHTQKPAQTSGNQELGFSWEKRGLPFQSQRCSGLLGRPPTSKHGKPHLFPCPR